MKKCIAMFIISVAITSWIGVSLPGNIVFADEERILENQEDNPTEILEDKDYLDNPTEDKVGNLLKQSVKDEEPVSQETEIEKNSGSPIANEFDQNKEELFRYRLENMKQESIQNEKSDLEERTERTESKKETMASLQIPEKLDITIDPFEINEKGQIYSKEYTIKNSGETAGVLRISDFMCKPGENSGVIIKNNNNGIHDAAEKFVYMEIVFGNGHRIIFPSDEAEYEVRLEPGEELRFFYRGEINENASQGWREHDLMVGMVYFWNIEKEDSENEENMIKEDELRTAWENGDISDISERKDYEEMKRTESSSFEEEVNEEVINSEEKLKFGEKDLEELQSDLIDGNKK